MVTTAAGADQVINLDKMFSKGFLLDKGKNKTPDYFADDVWNIRIKNQGITQRPGCELIYDGSNANEIQGIISNNDGRLYVVQTGHFREIDYIAGTSTDIGDISATGKCRFVTYGIYTIILTGIGYPWVYDGTTLSQLSSSEIPVNTNPSFGTTFAGFTVVNSSLNPNVLYISQPIDSSNQNNSYKWLGTGSQTLTFKSKVQGVIGTLNNLWVFTEHTVERMGKDNLSNTGGITGLFTIPLGSGYLLASPDAVCGAGDVIFFMTKTKKIGTINYKKTVAEPQMAIISDEVDNSIDGYMQNHLMQDQSDSWMTFDRIDNVVKINVQSTQSTVNDVFVIYDIQNITFLKDKTKYYSCGTIMNDKLYCGSAFSFRVIQEEIGKSDIGVGIPWSFTSTEIVIGSPVSQKFFRGMEIAGQINNLCDIRVQVLVDKNYVYDKVIRGSEIADAIVSADILLGIGGSPIGDTPISGYIYDLLEELVDFERYINTAGLRYTGKKIQFIFSGENPGQNFILDFFQITYRTRARRRLQDAM